MLKTLRRRLTALFTGLTALVLGGALLVTGSLSASQYAASAEILFANTLNSLCNRLSDAESVTDTWLTAQESESNCLILLCDNGAALHFKGAQPSDTAQRRVSDLVPAAKYGFHHPSQNADGLPLYGALAGWFRAAGGHQLVSGRAGAPSHTAGDPAPK